MDRVIRVVGVSFNPLTTGFTLIFARLIARDRISVQPDDSIFHPQPRTHRSECEGKGAEMPLVSSLLLTILP